MESATPDVSTEGNELIARVPTAAVICCLLGVAAVLAVLLVFLAMAGQTRSRVRVRNDMNFPLYRVAVNGHLFGTIAAGKSSEYVKMQGAYPSSSVVVIAEGRELRLQPEDHFGETPLGRGEFTYALTVQPSSPSGIVLETERDSSNDAQKVLNE